jgi:hypothetical protein
MRHVVILYSKESGGEEAGIRKVAKTITPTTPVITVGTILIKRRSTPVPPAHQDAPVSTDDQTTQFSAPLGYSN